MSNSILQSVGNLDVVNATLRAPKVEVTTSVGVANTSVTETFSVADKFHVDKDSIDPVSITGNVVASGIKISNLTIGPAFDFASVSNVGNVTANVIQFANATTGFTTTANVEIGGNISITSNAQVKVGSNVLVEYTGPHLREPKELPIKKYPEITFNTSKFDKNDTTNTYTQGGYTISANTQYNDGNYAPWEMYVSGTGPVTGTHYWSNHSTHLYNAYLGGTLASPTAHTQTVVSSVTYSGIFTTIQLPHKIKLNSIDIQSHNAYYFPHSGIIAGSTNGSSWDLIHSFSDLLTSDTPIIENIITNSAGNTNHYNYFRLIITKGSGAAYIGIRYLRWNGTEEPAPVGDISLDTTLKSTFNSVRSNNYVMYFDGEDPQGSPVVPKNLVNGSSISITPHNAAFDATNNCWTLNGSTESNVTTGDLGFEGDVPHTVSMWVNSSNLDANATTQQLFSIGSGYDKALVRVDDTQIAANTWHNVTYAYQGEGGSKVTYLDGRKVEEEKVEDTFGEYPPFSMTDYEIGGYRVSASSEYTSDENSTRRVWAAYADGGAWMTEFDVFGRNASSNNNAAEVAEVTITDTDGTSHIGHYTILETPFRFRASYLVISSSVDTRRPESVVILGSNDNENWDLLYTNTSVPDDNDNTLYFNSTKGYKYHMFMVKNLDPGGEGALYISRLRYFGDKEGDLTRFPEPTKVLKYPTIVTKNGTGEPALNFPTHTGQPYDSYAMRGHVIKASESIASYPAYAAFNGQTHIATGTVWVGGYNHYGTSHGNGTGGYGGGRNLKTDLGTGGSATSNGSWLYIEMPHKIKVTSTKIVSYDTSPSTGHPPENVIIYGTNDPSSSGGWNVVDNTYASSSSGIPNNQVGKTWAVSTASSPTAYKYFALVIVKVNNSGTVCHALINDWQLIGTQEDTQTPAIVGGPFAGKVANFRVYDRYLGEERIQEIYDAQKDAFGHNKSSMTFYKGRIGVGTTEPEGALTVLDEPHALEKFPARAVSSDDSYVEGEGETVIRTADGSGYQAFDGLESTSWASTPTRHTRLSEEVDLGAWVKIETPESMSLKKAEFESNPYWNQVGSETYGGSIDHTITGEHFGRAVACSHDGTRVIVGYYVAPNSTGVGKVQVYDWNGSSWTRVGQILDGPGGAADDKFGHAVAISGDGNIIAVTAPFEHVGSAADKGTVRVYYLVGSTWTILPDSGSLTGDTTSGLVDVFLGETAADRLGLGGVKLSYDGYTIAMGEVKDDTGVANIGRVRVFTYSNGAWSQKGSTLVGNHTEEEFGQGLDMSEDGNHLIIGTKFEGGTSQPPRVEVYRWTGSAWAQKGSSITYADINDGFGPSVSISNDGNTIGIGIKNADAVEGAPDLTTSTNDTDDHTGIVYVYHWNGSAWGTPYHLVQPGAGDHDFGDHQVMSGDGKRLIVGASHADFGTGDQTGRLYTFEFRGDSWLRRPVPMVGADGGDNAYLGSGPSSAARSHAISRDGSVIVAGEFGFYTNGVAYAGRVRIYNMPSNIKSIWGSNDNENWTKITTAPTREEATSNVAGLQFGYDDRLEFKNIDNPNYYKYHTIVADAFTRLENVKLFGVRKQGSSTLHDGALTLTKNLNVPRIGAPPDVDNTPRRDRLIVEYNTSTNPVEDGLVRDTSGRGNDGVFYGGASYDATQKALVFDGTASNQYVHTLKNGSSESGNKHYSVSLWFNPTTVNVSRWRAVFAIGVLDRSQPTDNDGDEVTLFVRSGSDVLHLQNGGSSVDTTDTVKPGQWVHIVVTYDGKNRKIYLDGSLSVSNGYSSINFPKEMLIRLAQSIPNNGEQDEYMDCKISNFKAWFGAALTTEEVKTLYDMGRCDEGHHVVNFSKTRVGIGLGDGEAPRGALDVRGDIYGGMPVFFDVRFTSAPTATHAGSRIVWDTINDASGGGFDTSTGTFTAPIGGVYKFSYFARGNISGQGIKMKPRINGLPTFNTTSDGTNQNLRGTAFMGNDGYSGSASTIVPLEAGGTFDLFACSHGTTVTSSLSDYYNGFTGEYISSL